MYQRQSGWMVVELGKSFSVESICSNTAGNSLTEKQAEKNIEI